MSTNQSVSVADLLDRQVPLDWFESVAIVAGLCSALGDRPASAMPALDHIHLTWDGTITLASYGSQSDDAVLRLLHDCLRQAAHPPALRLFVLNALSAERHRSPAALEEALGYYERPGRAAIIQGVRARCLSADGQKAGSADGNGASDFEVDKAARARSGDAASTRRRQLVRALGIAACAVGVASAVTLVYMRGWPAGNAGSMQGLANYVAETGRGLVDAVKNTLNPAAAAPVSPATADATPSAVRKPRRARSTITSGSHEQPSSIAEATATADATAIQAVADESFTAGSSSVDAVPAIAPEAAGTNPEVGETAEIMPPRLIDPVRLPRWATVATSRSAQVMELAITDAGKVERVRLVSPAVRMTDIMMLSAAKTWTFEPALQSGHPTSYTLLLNVATTP